MVVPLCCASSACRSFAASALAVLRSSAWRSYHAFHSSKGRTWTVAYMFAWLRPQSSAHWPWYVPAFARNHVWFV